MGRSKTSAGGVVIRRGESGVEIVVGSQRDRLTGDQNLRLPKGVIEPGESPEQAAAREVSEETGVEARAIAPLGDVRYVYQGKKGPVDKRVFFFLMEYESGDPHARDGEMTGAHWCAIEEAARTLTFQTERDVVERARAQIESEEA